MITVTEENRTVTNVSATIISVLMMVSITNVWLAYYNNYVFRTHRPLGAVISLLIWLILYVKFAKVYRAFKIASTSIGETIFSQFLSFGLADLLLYVAGCLVARCYVDIVPGVVTVVIQLGMTAVWATKSKGYFLNHVAPRDCLLLYDADISDEERVIGRSFASKLEGKYGHLFNIVEHLGVGENLEETYATIEKYPILFLYDMPLEKRSNIISYCVNYGKRIYVTPTIEDVISRGYEVKNFIDTPIMTYNGNSKRKQTYFGKRILDIISSLILIIITSPIMVITAVGIKLEDGGKIFFRQARYTQDGKVFNIIKFRSMIMDAEKDGKPIPCVAGDSRITHMGRFIRSTRIDELPQLFNILAGDLSMVGPRPERVEHADLYTKELPEFRYRLRVKAGLTGYAQIYGKYNTSARDKLLLDLLYIEQQSLFMDMRIVFLTLKIIFTPESTEGFEEDKSKAISQKVTDKERATT